MSTPDDDVKSAVKEILLEHRGSSNPISSREISERFGLDDIGSFPNTRAVIRKLVMEEKLPVASGSQGYYIIETEDELADYLETLEGRMLAIADRKYGVRRAAQDWDGDIEPSDDADIL